MSNPLNFKLNLKKKRELNIDRVYLECTSDGHNKSYEFVYHGLKKFKDGDKHIVTTRYGKIGHSSKTDQHTFDTKADAYRFINKKTGEKFKKGYVRVMVNPETNESYKYKYNQKP